MKRKVKQYYDSSACSIFACRMRRQRNADKATQPVQNEVQTEASAVSEETAGKAAETEEVSKSCSPEELTGTVVIWDWDGEHNRNMWINLMRYTPM